MKRLLIILIILWSGQVIAQPTPSPILFSDVNDTYFEINSRKIDPNLTSWQAWADALYINTSGDTYSGTHDFSGATLTFASGQLDAASMGGGSVSDAEFDFLNGVTSAIQTQLDARCLESVFGTAIGTGLTLDGTTLKTHAALQSIAGLTEADVSIIETTADNAYNVVTSGGNNYIFGSNSDNTALEFKTPANVLSQIGAQPLDSDLTAIAALDTTAYGIGFLDDADANEARTTLDAQKRHWIDVTEYGADDTGVVDCSSAIEDAIDAALDTDNPTGPHIPIYFPTGTYLITSDAVFSHRPDTQVYYNIRFIGNGMYDSVINIEPQSASDIWLYKNPGTSQIYVYSVFEHLGFISTGDYKAYGNGFWLQQDQLWTFNNCRFRYFDHAFIMDGTSNASEHTFISCKFTFITGDLYTLSNVQSVNHYFYGCTFSNCQGNVFRITDEGGGEIYFYGGYIHMVNAAGDTDMHYLYYCDADSGGVGSGNLKTNFYNAKTELKSAYSGLVYKNATYNSTPIITFDKCNLYTTSGGNRTVVDVNNVCDIYFENCTIPSAFDYSLASTNANYIPTLTFEDCTLPSSMTDNITITSAGTVFVRNCIGRGSYDDYSDDYLNYIYGTYSCRGTIDPCDTTPDVSGYTRWVTSANGVATAITDLDNPVVDTYVTIVCGSTTNASTIADSGNFELIGAWSPDAVGNNITLWVRADNDYVEVSRFGLADSVAVSNWNLTTPTITAGGSLKNGATSAGFVDFFEDSDNGTNYIRIIGPASTGTDIITLPIDTEIAQTGLLLNTAGTLTTMANISDSNCALDVDGDAQIESLTVDYFINHGVTAGITAVNPGGQGDGVLTKEINEVSTVGTADDAVTLPVAVAGRVCRIANNGANQLEIWPNTDDDAGAGANTAVTLAAGSNVTYIAYDGTNWELF